MWIAKTMEDGTRVQFDEAMNATMERSRYVLQQMKLGLTEDGYEVYYQPVYSGKCRGFCSAEALVRLRGQDGALISPGEFIPIAEATGMIQEITWVIIEKVCKFLAEHPEVQQEISINLSAQQFREEGMEAHLEQLVRRYRVEHRRIKLELTERTLAENAQQVEETMHRLMDKGVGFYLDDFGTGYSNFSAVLALPFETVKLDKSLTDQLLGPPREHQFVSSMVHMLQEADYTIVAEGAEGLETVEELGRLGVDRIQGFYYARPMPEGDFLQFLEQPVG
jgi:EAL domain-containing protein (putative c-di-GMP-specific phosphodiesterase class I)